MTVYKVEVHGFKITSQSKQVLLRVPEIGRYVSTYYMNRGSFGDAEKKFATAFTELQTPECPVAATWNADCDGSAHKYLETNADMLRGDLKEGKTGDQEYNYKWNFNGFIDETSGDPSAVYGTVQNAKPVSTAPAPTVSGGSPKIDTVAFNRECATNDRTALMQAVAFTATSPEEVLENATKFAKFLNSRTVLRMSPMVNSLQEDGAVVTDVKPAEERASESLEYWGVDSAEKLQAMIAKHSIDTQDIKGLLNSHDFEDSKGYLEANGGSFQSLAKFIYDGLVRESEASGLAW